MRLVEHRMCAEISLLCHAGGKSVMIVAAGLTGRSPPPYSLTKQSSRFLQKTACFGHRDFALTMALSAANRAQSPFSNSRWRDRSHQ